MIRIVIMIIALCCPGSLLWAGNAVIDLKDNAEVKGNIVTLADLAEVKGADASQLSGISIMKTPEGRSGATLPAYAIVDRIHSVYQGSVELKGATQVHIKARFMEMDKETLEKAFREQVLAQSPWKDKGKIEIDNMRVARCPTLRDAGPVSLQANFSPHEDFLGSVTANITVSSGTSQDKVAVTGRVKLYTDIPVLRTKIKAGSMIMPADIMVKNMDISTGPKVCTSPEECVGKRAKTNLTEGKPILAAQVERKPDICSGEVVFIEARVNNLVIRDKGVAMKDGFQGDSIPVKNVGSGRQVFGTIIADSLVQVEM